MLAVACVGGTPPHRRMALSPTQLAARGLAWPSTVSGFLQRVQKPGAAAALSPSIEASAFLQRELGASLHRHKVEVFAMTVDEALDEWAVRQHRQPFCTGVVQHGFDE